MEKASPKTLNCHTSCATPGMVLSQAKSAVETAGYEVEVRNESSDSVGKWYVIGTDPRPGTRLPEGETVVIRQSTGKG